MKDSYDLGYRLHFAYGSNLNVEQVQARCHQASVVTVARLADYKLAFYGHSKQWDGGEATLMPRPGEDLWGVVYQLSFGDAETLDSWQDVRLDGTGPYFLYPTVVADERGNPYPVLLYKKNDVSDLQMPSREHLDQIITGAQRQGLPPDYLEKLRRLDARPAGFAVPKKSRFDRSILTDRCGGCDEAEAPLSAGVGGKPALTPAQLMAATFYA
jgi:hypothetical protein